MSTTMLWGSFRCYHRAALLALLAAAATAGAHDKHQQPPQQTPAASPAAEVALADVKLLDQDGTTVSFRDDIVGDKVVVINFIYTRCTTVCPVQSAIFSQLQTRLGERLGAEVRLVSISVDPLGDSPERLKAYAQRNRAGPGWRWLTGAKPDVDRVLQGLGAYTPEFADHPAMVLVGDGRSGDWTRFFGFPGPEQLLAKIDQLSTTH